MVELIECFKTPVSEATMLITKFNLIKKSEEICKSQENVRFSKDHIYLTVSCDVSVGQNVAMVEFYVNVNIVRYEKLTLFLVPIYT